MHRDLAFLNLLLSSATTGLPRRGKCRADGRDRVASTARRRWNSAHSGYGEHRQLSTADQNRDWWCFRGLTDRSAITGARDSGIRTC